MGGGTKTYDYNPTTDPQGTTPTFTADFNITEAWILSSCDNGFYWNRYKAGDTKFYQYYGASATPFSWGVAFPNGASGMYFSISGKTFSLNTGNVSSFNVKNLVILIG